MKASGQARRRLRTKAPPGCGFSPRANPVMEIRGWEIVEIGLNGDELQFLQAQ